MYRRILWVVPVLTAVAVEAAPVPADRPPTLYFPTRVGATWVYGVSDGNEVTHTVTAVERVGDETHVTETHKFARPPAWGQASVGVDTIAVSGRGLSHINSGQATTRPPAPLLRVPITVGDEWPAWTHQSSAELPPVMIVRGAEKVKVPAGEFDAVKVEIKANDKLPADSRFAAWYVVGVGRVKVVDGARTYELKSFTPGTE